MPVIGYGKVNHSGYRKYPIDEWLDSASKLYIANKKLSRRKRKERGWPCLILEHGSDFDIKPRSMAAYIWRHCDNEPIAVQWNESTVRIFYYGQDSEEFQEA